MQIHIDIETDSTADLTEVGAYNYFENPETDINTLCYGINSEPVQKWKDPCRNRIPAQLEDAIFQGREQGNLQLWAHNAAFERTGLNSPVGAMIGFPKTTRQEWRCTMALCCYYGLPKSLEQAAQALNLAYKKDAEGKKVMLLIARKYKTPTKKDPLMRWSPLAHSAMYEKLYDYCARDVEVERALHARLPALPDIELKTYWLDQLVNDRGALIDRPFVDKVCQVIEHKNDSLHAEAIEICGFKTSQIKEVMQWANAHGARLEGFTKDDIAQALTDANLPEKVQRVLQIRQSAAKKTSGSKFHAAARSACSDGRVRGMFRYHLAATGRWASTTLQLHNLPNAGYDDDIIQDFMDVDLAENEVMPWE